MSKRIAGQNASSPVFCEINAQTQADLARPEEAPKAVADQVATSYSPAGQDTALNVSASAALTIPRKSFDTAAAASGIRLAQQFSSGNVIRNLASKIDHLKPLSAARKTALHHALQGLALDLAPESGPVRTPIYLMEGATGITEDHGRVSTDPDENMALKVIRAVARQRNHAAIVAVPNAANQKHTSLFLSRLGASVGTLNAAEMLRGGTVYVVREDDATAMTHLAQATQLGRDLFVLGPPLGYAQALLEDDVRVRIMGSVEVSNGALIPSSLSTNTKNPASAQFFLEALKRKPKQFSSRGMGPALAIPLAELAMGTSLITEADKRHWSRNSEQQFLGTAPQSLLAKRLEQSGAKDLFVTKRDETSGKKRSPLELDPQGKGLAFASLVKQTVSATPNPSALKEKVRYLGTGYEALVEPAADVIARAALTHIMGAHRAEKGGAMSEDYEAGVQIIKEMTPECAVHTFVALGLAFKSIYDEKTVDGWFKTADAGQQWRAEQFVKSYVAQPGRQVPYDALVVLEPYCGMGSTEADKKVLADKVQLVLWTD